MDPTLEELDADSGEELSLDDGIVTDSPLEAAPMQPIRVVERELTRPDGTTVVVEVPVYPPFQLDSVRPTESKKKRGPE